MEVWMDGLMDEVWMDGWMDERMDEVWMDEVWIDGCIYACVN